MALGKIKADTLEHSTAGALDTSYVVNGSAKVWLYGPATVASISDSFNISSVDDDGTGDFGIHFSNNFNTANYVMTHAVNDGGASTAQFATDITYGTNTTATTDIENHYVTAGDNRTNADSYGIMITFCGRLA